ncbi:MAG: MFS transporter [Bauldia sp.]
MTAVAPRVSRLGVGAWVLFDWSTQPFYTLITTFVFAPYFATHLAATPVVGQSLWGYATAAAGAIIALLSPILGAIADAAGRRKPWIAVFSAMLIVGALALWFAAPGRDSAVMIALVAFVIATVGVEFATAFNNAVMPDLVSEDRLGRLSGIGWATGYAGGLVSLVIVIGFLAANPETGKTLLGLAPILGLDAATFEGDRAVGPFSALWFLVFVLPFFLLTPDRAKAMPIGLAARQGLAQIARTIGDLGRHANIVRYLIAHMVYTDGLVALFSVGGIYAASTFGWSAIELGFFGILLTVTGAVGALVGGWLDDRVGSKLVIFAGLAVLVLSALAILSIDADHLLFVITVAPAAAGDGLFASAGERAYLAIGAAIGAVAGPLQAASRTLMARISPRQSMTEFFGLYALSGKVTSFAGPLTVGLATAAAASQRVGVAVLVVFFGLGGFLLIGVKSGRG